MTVFYQTQDPGAPPTAPSLTTSQEHAAHPDVQPGTPDTGHTQTMQLTDPRPTAGTDPDPRAARAVSDFISKASIDGLTEIQLGRLVLSRSQNAGIQHFAKQMIADYEQSDSALNAVAMMKNVSVPKELDAPHQAVVQSLSAKQGHAFDAAYLDQMLTAQQRAITLYTAAAGQTDSEVAAFAYKALPTLQNHRQMAEALKSAH
jgi:putative membrane protein